MERFPVRVRPDLLDLTIHADQGVDGGDHVLVHRQASLMEPGRNSPLRIDLRVRDNLAAILKADKLVYHQVQCRIRLTEKAYLQQPAISFYDVLLGQAGQSLVKQ